MPRAGGEANPGKQQLLRVIAATLPPLIAFLVQRAFWPSIGPFAWFLFYPAVFISSWLGGFGAGLFATFVSTVLAWWWFIPPEHALIKDSPKYFLSAGVFIVMGILFSVFNGRLRRANRRVESALGLSRTANEALQRANERVQHLYEKTRDLDDLKTQFFAAVSHELRTPLTLILGPTERLLAAGEIGPAAGRDLEVIARNARTLLRHVNDLLDVSKLEARRMRADYADARVDRLVRFVAGHFDALAGEKRVSFTVDATEEVRAHVDPEKMRRVLLNLLSNAFKFTPDGGRVRVTLRAEAETVRIEVADSGPGIPPDKREAAFERFRQLEGGSTRRFGGTGLGLSIARDLVALHGGTLGVADADEGGASFVVELPRWAPSESVLAPEATDESAAVEEARSAVDELRAPGIGRASGQIEGVGSTLVLIAEDNVEMNRFLCESLQTEHRVTNAYDGEEALRKAIALRPDLVLTDVMMPKMSGDALVRALRERSELAATPIVLLTAKADDELRVQLLRAGAQDYVTKPFSVEELRARVGNLVGRKLVEDQLRTTSEQLRKVADASTQISAAVAGLPESSLNAVLHAIALQAQTLTGARYAAVGIGTDPNAPFDPMAAVGVSPEEERAIGRSCRPTGVLGVVARDNQILRLRDLREHPAHLGFPDGHPVMRSFLGAPISLRGVSVGNLYLAEKRSGEEFTLQDERLVEMLAARASIAIETAGLYRAEGKERAWLQAVVDQMPEAIVLMDAEGRVQTQNATAQLFAFGERGERDPFGNPVVFDMRRPDGVRLAPTDTPIVRAIQHGEAIVGQELSLRLGDGSFVSVLASAAPVRDRDGRVLGATMVMQDISPIKELERLREEWSSIVAHDLRQPLNGIVLSAQLLARMRVDDPNHVAVAERIHTAAKRLNRMVDDLLDTSRIEAGRMTIEPREINLAGLVRELLARVPDLGERCEVRVDPTLRVVADAGRVEQVLLNLVSNAAKYGEAGSRIEVEAAARGDDAELSVGNRGRGIPPEEMPLLFHRFARTRDARKSSVNGLGLGLHICKGLVEAHGGTIWAESVPGHTTFRFTLPRLPRRERVEGTVPTSAPPA